MTELRYEFENTGVPILGLLFSLIRFPFHAVGVVILNPMIAIRMLKFAFQAR